MSTPGSIGSGVSSLALALSPAPPGSVNGAVQGGVDETIGVGVLAPLDVADRPAVEIGELAGRLGVELAHRRVFDFVAAFDLAHDQLRVSHQLELGATDLAGGRDPEQQRPV